MSSNKSMENRTLSCTGWLALTRGQGLDPGVVVVACVNRLDLDVRIGLLELAIMSSMTLVIGPPTATG
jgi:hypothetical protein